MNMNDIIVKKRDGGKLTTEEIGFFVKGYAQGDIPDYQAAALLMAIYFQKMDKEETFALTDAMRYSGDTVDLSGISGIKVDKHSTGGVGDKTTLICAPLAAACGIPIAKMSGRGLGFTGGTVDKLEAIPGFQTTLEPAAFLKQFNELGSLMCEIGSAAGKKTVAVVTDMNQPLGHAVGNSLEVIEAIETLKGNGPADITELSLKLAGVMIFLGARAKTAAEGEMMAKQALYSGAALAKLKTLITRQGGNPAVIEDYDLLPSAAYSMELTAPEAGFITSIDARAIGLASQHTGAGRQSKEDSVDLAAGIYLHCKVGDKAAKGEVLATLYGSSKGKLAAAVKEAEKAFVIGKEKPERPELIKEILGL